jgi:predicted nucleic acid-binding protein
MNGNRYLLDTNAIIALLQGNTDIKDVVSNAEWVGTSVICILEFYSFPKMSVSDKLLLDYFITKIHLVNLPTERSSLAEIAKFKIQSKLKLPDPIIGSSSIENNAILISRDKDFENVNGLQLLKFE